METGFRLTCETSASLDYSVYETFPFSSLEQQSGPEEDSFSSDLSLNSPMKKVEFNLELELIGGEPEPAKAATRELMDNENNNNDINAGVCQREALFRTRSI